MKHYMVFGSVKRPLGGGGSYLDWTSYNNPIGVYEAENPDEACMAAASDIGGMGTFLAVEGNIWGVELLNTKANRLGSTRSANDRLAEAMENLEKSNRQIAQLRAAGHTVPEALEADDDDMDD